MKNDTIANPGKRQQATREAVGTPAAAGGKAHFNPLHPSMELPPEQLIRLLGVESKKTRQQDRSLRRQEKPSRQQSKSPQPNQPVERTVSQLKRESSSQPQEIRHSPEAEAFRARRERERPSTARSAKKRSGIFLPAMAVGVLTGIAVSVYLFWSQPETATPDKLKPAPVASRPLQQPEARRQPDKNESVAPTAPKPKVAAPTAPQPRPTTVPVKKQAAKTVDETQWQASVEAETRRLSDAAERRLNRLMTQVESPPDIEGAGIPETTATAADSAGIMQPHEETYPDGDMESAPQLVDYQTGEQTVAVPETPDRLTDESFPSNGPPPADTEMVTPPADTAATEPPASGPSTSQETGFWSEPSTAPDAVTEQPDEAESSVGKTPLNEDAGLRGEDSAAPHTTADAAGEQLEPVDDPALNQPAASVETPGQDTVNSDAPNAAQTLEVPHQDAPPDAADAASF
jgi:hypothetical protein